VNRSLYCTFLLLQNRNFFSVMVTGAGYRAERVNNNRGIANASTKAVCTCNRHNKCACNLPGKKKVCNGLTAREHEISQAPCNLADLLIPIFFNHTLQSCHCLLLHVYPLNTTHSSSISSTSIHSLSRATSPTAFPLVIGQTTKGFYCHWPTNLKLSLIRLNLNRKKAHNITESR